MRRNEVKELLPIMQAFAEGKTIEERIIGTDNWIETDEIYGGRNNDYDYRVNYHIKPEPKYRPFKNTEECWNEMQKHQPFGWLKDKNKDSVLMNIQALFDEMLTITDGVYFRGINLINGWHGFEEAVKEYTFADGTPFGIKEEE